MAYDISLTGIRAQMARLEVASNNIANVETPGYSFYRALLATQRGTGGVQVADIEQPRPASTPEAPADVELPAELVEAVAAQRAFEANVRMIEVQGTAQDFFLNRLRPM
ncbi:flagellar basal body rod protein FlgC [Endothiovibrio diazotrophicus]